MLQWEHSAILSTFIKLPFILKTFDLLLFLSGHLIQVLQYNQISHTSLNEDAMPLEGINHFRVIHDNFVCSLMCSCFIALIDPI